jgi:hypothetical protein
MTRRLLIVLAACALLGIAGARADFSGPPVLTGDCTTSGGAPTSCLKTNGATFTSLLRGYIAGLVTSNDGTSPNTVIDIATGSAIDDTFTYWMQVAAFTKNMNAAWASGTAAGCLDGHGAVTTLQATTEYWIYLIYGPGKTIDFVCSSQAFGVVDFPTGYTLKRAIGWVLTDGSSHIPTFVQDDDTWYYGSVFKDINLTNTAAAASLNALTIPTGIKTRPAFVCAATGAPWWVTSPDQPDLATNSTFGTSPGANETTNTTSLTFAQIYSNTSKQIRVRPASTTNTLVCYTSGFNWARGRLN